MSNKKVVKSEIKNNKELKVEKKKLDKESFKNIKAMFRRYWKVLFLLIGLYIVSYLIWSRVIVEKILAPLLNHWGLDGGKGKEIFWLVLFAAILRGLLYALDGWITALLKTPFNQLCYTVNKTSGLTSNPQEEDEAKRKKTEEKNKEYIISKATESNEHCKETLKKFGILTISVEVLKVFILGTTNLAAGNIKKYGDYADWLNISYLIPLVFAANNIWQVHRRLKKIEKRHRLDKKTIKN